MSRPVKEKSLDGATSTGAGTALELGGRITLGMFVVTDADPTTLDVQVEVTVDGTNWASFDDTGGNDELTVAADDFEDPDGDGSYAAYVSAHGVAAESARPNVTGYGSAGNVDVWLIATSNPQTSKQARTTG